MSSNALNPEYQNALLSSGSSSHDAGHPIPPSLARSTLRLQHPPSYVLVGVYRLCTDKQLYQPAWQKCRNGTQRGVIIGLIWTSLTFGIQHKFIQVFLSHSKWITSLSPSPDSTSFLGLKLPFRVTTYATILLLGSQFTSILRFFLARNIRIASERVWNQTIASRGKSQDFWTGYVEEFDNPPSLVSLDEPFWEKIFGKWVMRVVVRRVLLLPVFTLYPILGILVSAWVKGLGTGRYLHERYFDAKGMTKVQRGVFVEERKWDYRLFGFTAALLESLPFIGLFFTISNRVGAAMWAHDLEKRQHFIREQKALKVHE